MSSNYFLNRQLIAQGLKAPEGKKSPGKKEKPEGEEGALIITLDEWYAERRKELTGKCAHCGGPTAKFDAFGWKSAIAHILPKRPKMFPSVRTHPDNWIELCSWGNNCHGNYDSSMLDLMQLNCFDLVIQKFIRFYPFIDKKERRNIPDVLLQYIEVEK